MKILTQGVVLSTLLFAATASAGPLVHRQLVERLLTLFGVETVYQSVLGAVVQQAVEAEPALAGSEKALGDFLSSRVGWARLKPEAVELYMGEFSEEEMTEILRFYESRTGRKLAALSPAISAHVMEWVQQELAKAESDWEALIASLLPAAENE
ncbi:MAG: DUF2059 domain-containing protein [Kiritimatiellae bacterium]|nr:DUF2059 domain-containing protein [Kiritimatiellia bacterium]